ncbi:MAG: T9SS type A sorting domain-containing protein, partial [Bacteroidota bacterium]
FSGSDPSTIGGQSPTTFENLSLEKNTPLEIDLDQTLAVNGELHMQATALALNGYPLSIHNPHNTAILRSGNAYINGETNRANNTSQVCWATGNNSDTYEFPFGISFGQYIPIIFDKQEIVSTTLCIATRGTTPDNTPYTTGTNMESVSGGGALYVIDRWWDIESSVNPLPGRGAHITLSYDGSENTLPAGASTGNLQIQHFDSHHRNEWDAPYAHKEPGMTSGIGTVSAFNLTTFSPHVIVPENIALSSHLLSFTGQAQPNHVDLTWETNTDAYYQYYTVERSSDGINYEALGSRTAQVGGIEPVLSYDFQDLNPREGLNYYRLRLTKIQGESEYADPIVISYENPEKSLRIYPNPNTGAKFYLRLDEKLEGKLKLRVYDNQGLLVHQEMIDRQARDKQDLSIGLESKLSSGIYHLEIASPQGIQRKSFIVR